MALKAGKPTTLQTQKEKAIAAVQEVEVQEALTMKTQRLNVDLSEELHAKMKVQAIKEGIKLNVLVRKIFDEYLKNNA
ncbi:MAG: plasmid partition protein ParG [Methylococcales bacterium]|jgi:predicted HicB family RNase H-like nuclease